MNLPCMMLFKGFRLKMMWECFAVGDPIRSNQTHTFAAVGCAPHHFRYLASGPCGRCVHSMFLCIYRTCFLCQGCTSIQRLACRPYVKKNVLTCLDLFFWGNGVQDYQFYLLMLGTLEGRLYCTLLVVCMYSRDL